VQQGSVKKLYENGNSLEQIAGFIIIATTTAMLAVCCRQVQVVGSVGEEAAGDERGPFARRDALQPDLVHGDDARQQE